MIFVSHDNFCIANYKIDVVIIVSKIVLRINIWSKVICVVIRYFFILFVINILILIFVNILFVNLIWRRIWFFIFHVNLIYSLNFVKSIFLWFEKLIKFKLKETSLILILNVKIWRVCCQNNNWIDCNL